MHEKIVDATGVANPPQESKAAKKKLAEMTLEEKRKYNRATKKKQRTKDAAISSAVGRKYFSTTEIGKKEAFAILEQERNIRHPRVLEVCYELAQIAARNLGIPLNAHLLAHGTMKTLEAVKTKQEQDTPSIEDVCIPGSRIRLHEEFALYDFGAAWRVQADKTVLSFDRWRELRRVAQTDVFRFGNEVIGMNFEPNLHGKWCHELFVMKNPDLLPEKYTWNDVRTTLAAQSEIHQRLLMSNRSSFKSSYNLVDMLSWVLVFGGDIRILMCSATQPLSKGFLKKFKSYWTYKITDPTLFNQIFPEFMMFGESEQGSERSFISPMRRLDLIEPTLNSVSIISEGLAGGRADLLVLEDIAEISNSSTEEMREKTVLAVDMLRELVEPFGYLQAIGTPFAPEDVYSVMLDREDKRIRSGEEPKLLYQINPAWRVKEGIRKLPYDQTLTQDEVELTFPNRIGTSPKQVREWFNTLKDKLRENVNVFRQQSLCEWVPDEENTWAVTFTREELDARVKPISFFQGSPVAMIVGAVDTAFSVAVTADRSAVVAAKIFAHNGKNVVYIVEVLADRWRYDVLAQKIVEVFSRNGVQRAVIERSGPWETLQSNVQRQAAIRGAALPHIVFKASTSTGTSVPRKVMRIKGTQSIMENGQLYFAPSAAWNDSLFTEMCNFTGKRSSRTNDMIDAVSMVVESFMVRDNGGVVVTSAEQEEAEQQAAAQEMLRQQHAMYFPTSVEYTRPVAQEPEPPSAREHYFGGLGGFKK